MKNKKGFSLAELLMVMAILAILVIFAIPNVMKVFDELKKKSFVNESLVIYDEVKKQFALNKINNKRIYAFNSKDEESKLDLPNKDIDYCILVDKTGAIEKFAAGNKDYFMVVNDVGKRDSLTSSEVQKGNLEFESCSKVLFRTKTTCTYTGNLTQGATYVNGAYTYRYKQKAGSSSWSNISEDGWGVKLTNPASTDPVDDVICTTINDKPIVNADYMYYNSQASNIDLTSFISSDVNSMRFMFYNSSATEIIGLESLDTSSVTDMNSIFYNSKATTLDVSNFDTSAVTSMQSMFYGSKVTSLNVSNFNTSNVTDMSYMFRDIPATSITGLTNFNTSNVTNMRMMFYSTKNISTLDLSSFDTSNVADVADMFTGSTATTGYARTSADATKFNSSSNKPATLNFTVK